MKQFSGIVLAVLNIVVLVILMFCFVGCSSSSRTVIAARDTLYVERFVDRQIVIRDTVETSNIMVEYVIDSLGEWKPQKMVETTTLQKHTQKRGDEESVTETSFSATNTEVAEAQTDVIQRYVWVTISLLLIFVVIKLL